MTGRSGGAEPATIPHRRPLLILGTRLLAEEVADLVSDIDGLRLSGFVENRNRQRCQERLGGLPIHWVDELGHLCRSHQAVVALTTTLRADYVEQAAAYGIPFGSVVHPTARVARTSSVGEGTIVSAQVVVAAHTKVGNHALLNRGVLIGHHTELGACVTVNPGANIAGACRVENQAFVGMGALILDHVRVGQGAIIGAGVVVTGGRSRPRPRRRDSGTCCQRECGAKVALFRHGPFDRAGFVPQTARRPAPTSTPRPASDERRLPWHGLLPCPGEVLIELGDKNGGVDETRTRDLRRDRPAF